MDWVQTTLRKGTKTPRICRDMFITDSQGDFSLCQVKNGKMVSRDKLSADEAEKIISENKLVKTATCFGGCFTYRDWSSAKLYRDILYT